MNKMKSNAEEILACLLATGEAQKALHERAYAAKRSVYGDRVIVRGVVEVTNVCRMNCDYCPMRRDNAENNTAYSLSKEELLASCENIRSHGIDVILLQGGEVQETTGLMTESLPEIRKMFDGRVEIILCLGCKSAENLRAFRESGATGYILKHETCDGALHKKLRHISFQKRLDCLNDLFSLGYKVGTGIISSLPGQTVESMVQDIILTGSLGAHMASVSPFIAARNTPLQDEADGSLDLALNIVATMRCLYPNLLIPAVSAFSKLDPAGQYLGLMAGANTLTINFSPKDKLDSYLIYGKDRFVIKEQFVLDLLRKAGAEKSGSCWFS